MTTQEDINCCKYCRFYRAGECHKMPPVFIEGGNCVWPSVYEYDWCGEFAGNKEWDNLTRSRRTIEECDTETMIRKYKDTL